MVKKPKAKTSSKKGGAKPRAAAARPSGTRAKAAAKYDQPGAPWWKKTALLTPK
jgi:hypothetical protein